MTQPPGSGDIVGKAATGTIVVVGMLILIFCIAPALFCVGCGVVGQIGTR